MVIEQMIMILIAEPWDFSSTDGNNKFSGKIVEKTMFDRNYGKRNPNLEEAYLIKVNAPFFTDGLKVNYVVAEYRNKQVDSKGFNLYYLPDELVGQFMNLDNIINKLKFIIIGSAEDAQE